MVNKVDYIPLWNFKNFEFFNWVFIKLSHNNVVPTGSSPNGFSEKFYLIVIECTQDNRSMLHMWNLHLKSIPVSLGEFCSFI